MSRWVITGVVLFLVVLMLMPLIMAAGRRLRRYFSKEVTELDKSEEDEFY